MKIAIIGTGRLATILATAWSGAGHGIVFGQRDPDEATIDGIRQRIGGTVRGASIPDAVRDADVVVPAVPWPAFPAVIANAGDLSGKILISCSSPFKAPADVPSGGGAQLAYGHAISGAEMVENMAYGARVVLAFNQPGLEVLADPVFGEDRATQYICGNDATAKAAVAGLARDLGFDVVDAGRLHMARYIEPLALLWIDMARNQGRGHNFAFRLIERGAGLAPPKGAGGD